MKPVELMERSIHNSSLLGDLVLNCFGGSGSTLIAAEKAGRRCMCFIPVELATVDDGGTVATALMFWH